LELLLNDHLRHTALTLSILLHAHEFRQIENDCDGGQLEPARQD
jgi:hypothetical protein